MEVYIKSDLSFESLGKRVASAVNVASCNVSEYQREQSRSSENMGGRYFLFEVLSLELYLLRNERDVLISEMKNWPYYILIGSPLGEDFDLEPVAQILAATLRDAGFESLVADLAY